MSTVIVKVLRGVVVAGKGETFGVDSEVSIPAQDVEALIAAGIVAKVEAAAAEAPAKGKKGKKGKAAEADADL